MGTVVKHENRLPGSYRLRLFEAGVTQQALALASPKYRPGGQEVTEQFVNRCLLRKCACPPWLHQQLDDMLAQAAREAPK